MEKTTEQNQEIEFNLTKALIIIEKHDDMDDMFRSKYYTDYKMCHALINSGTGLKKEAEDYIKGLFNGVILVSERLTRMYLSLGDEPVVETEPVVEVKEEAPKKKKKVANKMRWGVRAIASDIADNFKGKSIQLHRTAMVVQELKKLYIRLEQRTWKERFKAETLSEKQLREIKGATETYMKNIDRILNPKK